MKIEMKYPGQYYENWNEISWAIFQIHNEIAQALWWKLYGNHKIIMKIVIIYPDHYYENCNEILWALLWKS